jgi:hypothetical protein
VDAPAAVLSLVLVELGVGGLALLWFLPTFNKVRHGYEILLGSTLSLVLWGAWAAMGAPLASVINDPAQSATAIDAATLVRQLVGVTTIVSALSVAAIAARQAMVGRVLGFASVAVGLASFVPFAQLRATRGVPGGVWQGILELALGALLMGAIWNGMILGHWYLVEKRLSNKYMVWMAWTNVAAVVAGVLAVAISSRNPVPCIDAVGAAREACSFSFSPLLGVGSLTIIMGLGVMSLIALIAGFNVKLAREGGRSIQASTGMFYLAVILAPAAEFAAKIRYF